VKLYGVELSYWGSKTYRYYECRALDEEAAKRKALKAIGSIFDDADLRVARVSRIV
jgi:hypothetical protein